MRIDALANYPHYLDHIAPVWNRLPVESRGTFYVDDSLITRAVSRIDDSDENPPVPVSGELPVGNEPVLVAGWNDIQNSGGRRHFLMEHGVGQSYEPYVNPAYAGGEGRQSVELFLCPNDYSAKLNADRYPDAHVAVIGSPRLEQLMSLQRHAGGRTIAFTTHFDLMLCEETRSSWSHFSPALKDMKSDSEWTILGHAHPRIFRDLAPTYTEWGIEPVRDFDEVIQRADCLVADNTSALFEFAAVVGPVVVMNAPWYRRDVNHGLRFWEAADVGPQVTDPLAVMPAVKQALAGWPGKEDALDLVFPPIEDPSAFAASVILKVLGQKPKVIRRKLNPFPKTAQKMIDAKKLETLD